MAIAETESKAFSTPTEVEPRTQRVRLAVSGLSCANCARSAQTALAKVPGVENARVNFATERADVRFDAGSATIDDLKTALEGAGYGGEIWAPAQTGETNKEWRLFSETGRLVIAVVLTLPLVAPMIFGERLMLPAFVQLALVVPVQFWLGARFYRGAWHAMKNRAANMDVLVALGTSAAFLYSVVVMSGLSSSQNAHLYFEASAVIITLVLLGKWLEERAKRGAGEAIQLLMNLRPQFAQIKRGDRFESISADDVLPGDIVLVRPGERIPVDGSVLKGRTDVDVSAITGESLPVERNVGDDVFGGSLNGSGAIEIEATSGAENSMLARIIELVENAQHGNAPVQRLVDRVSAIFVPSVVALSAVTFIAWLLSGGSFEQAMLSAIAVLVIACPCALGLATPTALVAGLGVAAKNGILIRDIEALERASKVDLVIFDKTGTLTEGRPEVVDIRGADQSFVLQTAAALQTSSEHILGRAILKESDNRGLKLATVENFENWVGEGVSGLVDGKITVIGNAALMNRFKLNIGDWPLDDGQPGLTNIYVGRGEEVIGVISLADQPREESREAIERLAARNVASLMLSGDSQDTALSVGQRIGLDRVEGDLKPEGKVQAIAREKEMGRITAMVGDGVNDAPALASADVGIAMGSGTDVAMATAGITLMRPDPRLVPAALDISKATERKIRQNLGWAFVYNLTGLPLAAVGLLSPTFAAAAMAASSVSVVTNSLLLRRWAPKR